MQFWMRGKEGGSGRISVSLVFLAQNKKAKGKRQKLKGKIKSNKAA